MIRKSTKKIPGTPPHFPAAPDESSGSRASCRRSRRRSSGARADPGGRREQNASGGGGRKGSLVGRAAGDWAAGDFRRLLRRFPGIRSGLRPRARGIARIPRVVPGDSHPRKGSDRAVSASGAVARHLPGLPRCSRSPHRGRHRAPSPPWQCGRGERGERSAGRPRSWRACGTSRRGRRSP